VHYGALSNPTFGWPVAGLLARELQSMAGDAWHIGCRRFVPTAGEMAADPACGIPGAWLGKGKTCTAYHSSSDTPEVCRPESLRFNTLLTAAWAYTMASLDSSTARVLVPTAVPWIEANILRQGTDDPARLSRWASARVLRDLRRWGVQADVYEPPAGSICPPGAPPLDDLPTAGPVYERSIWGTCTYETLTAERRVGLSRWSEAVTAGLYWNDGARPLGAVERLAAAEKEAEGVHLTRAFQACVEAGTMTRTEAQST
jgi:hypothetical protein